MVDLTAPVKSAPPSGSVKIDARTERWREHRLVVRESIVDAAMRAIDGLGPDVSMSDIAKEAGAAKAKLYRHFEDKTDLYGAVVERVRTLVWDRIMDSIDLFGDSVSELLHKAVAEYTVVVDEHPNLFRFLVQGHIAQQGNGSDRALDTARDAAREMAGVFTDATRDSGLDAEGAELVAYTVFGAVGSATDWWLGVGRVSDTMTRERFVEYLSAVVSGQIAASCRLADVEIDPDQPMHRAFGQQEDQP